jgi:hypothetical protein
LRSCSVVNSLTRRAGLAPAFQPTSLAQPFISLDWHGSWRGKLAGISPRPSWPSACAGRSLPETILTVPTSLMWVI